MKVSVKKFIITADENRAALDVDNGRTAMQRAWIDYCNGLSTEQLARIHRHHRSLMNDGTLSIEMLLAVGYILTKRLNARFMAKEIMRRCDEERRLKEHGASENFR